MTAKHATAAQLATRGHCRCPASRAEGTQAIACPGSKHRDGQKQRHVRHPFMGAGRSVPGPEARKALSKALGIAEVNLLPRAPRPPDAQDTLRRYAPTSGCVSVLM
jgi:hypothetical protein